MNRLLVPAALLLAALPLLAQEAPEDEEPSPAPISAHLSKASRLHKTPGGPSKGVIQSGEKVEVAGTSNGWVRVRQSGKTGWVDRRFLKPEDPSVDLAPKKFARQASAKTGCGVTSLKDCPPIGCATGDDQESKDHALMNTRKRGPGEKPAAPLTVAAFATLQSKADDLVGEAASLTPEERDSISNLDIGGVTTGEGHLVTVVGYLVGVPHPNTGESVNCNLTGTDNNDFHIPFADSPSKTPYEGIVIEAIPQDRSSGWTTAKMKKIVQAKQRVMVTGQLFYDSAHRVRTNPKTLTNQPPRFSLWEVHPVDDFLVCTKGKCSPSDPTQWTKLEDVP